MALSVLREQLGEWHPGLAVGGLGLKCQAHHSLAVRVTSLLGGCFLVCDVGTVTPSLGALAVMSIKIQVREALGTGVRPHVCSPPSPTFSNSYWSRRGARPWGGRWVGRGWVESRKLLLRTEVLVPDSVEEGVSALLRPQSLS